MKNSATLAIIFLYGAEIANCHSVSTNNNVDNEIIVTNSSHQQTPLLFIDTPLFPFETTARQQGQDQHGQSGQGNKKRKDLFSRILPLFVIPYLVQSAFLPMILISLKAMLLQTLLLGKLALILGVFNALRSQGNNAVQDKFSDNGSGKNGMSDVNVMKNYYGYNGNEEFGAWIHH